MAEWWEHCDVCGLSDNRHWASEHTAHENAQKARPTPTPEETR